MFPDRTMPDAFEGTLVEVFPAHAPGNFSWYGDRGKWVWTTFNEHQWDLNWANPQVFLEIVDIMLFLANRGVEVVRPDAVAFMWKRLGTRCQSEPEVDEPLHALRAASRVAAAALIHKEEAIVLPQEVIPYLGAGKHGEGRQPRLPQLADGAALVGARHALDAADDACDAQPLTPKIRKRHLGHVSALP